ncbi:unnamed protein product [Effrenium voratum]|uniref:Uncharacterized protein n=1 Tax=Effrenium voratum TaxID=2562239 RepID=A0AA36ITB8_9DINO|nr:unnamed protein product [Effrenium voratum]CAJ1459402.1 unnamed protein product [Effrenium voratum]
MADAEDDEDVDFPDTVQAYAALGTESGDSDSESKTEQRPEAVRNLMLKMSVLKNRMASLDLDSDDSQGEAAEGCLGTAEDRVYLAGMLKRFARDDLADDGDAVEAAIRMHISTVSMVKKWFYCILTCGCWIFFRPHDDTGVLILTKKGRVITYGKRQQADPTSVGGFLFKILLIALVICFGVMVFSLTIAGSGMEGLFWLDSIDFRTVGFVTLTVALVLLLLYLYSHRPRPDCGTSYRQHFAVNDLCAGVYAREDYGGCCGRRKSGRLKLAFTKFFPDEVSLARDLPRSAPNCNAVGPCAALPTAMAGDSAAVLQEQSRQAEEKIKHGGGATGIGHKTATFLAVLGTLGALYEYLAMLNHSVSLTPSCMFKVKGCSWKVDNTAFLGKIARVEGTLLPSDPLAANCDPNNNYCDHFWQSSSFCSPELGSYVKAMVALPCEELPVLFDILKPEHVFAHGVASQDVKYVVQDGAMVMAIPTPRNPMGGRYHVKPGLVLKSIGASDSETNALLAQRGAVDFDQVMAECESGPTGIIEVVLEEEPDVEPLFHEDCQQLQESCLAETWSPETNGWWPPNRWIDLRYERALCFYSSLPVWFTNGGKKIWRDIGGKDIYGKGLACHGEPLHNAATPTLAACQELCETTYGCNYIFHTQHPTMALNQTCLLYADCPSTPMEAPDQNFVQVPCEQKLHDYPRSALRNVFTRSVPYGDDDTHEFCWESCRNATGVQAQCNAFAVFKEKTSPKVSYACAIYGPNELLMLPPVWTRLTAKVDDVLAIEGINDGQCHLRRMQQRTDRKIMETPGTLWHFSDHFTCGGCFSRGVSSYYLEFPNLVTLVTQMVGVLAFVEVVRRSRAATPPGVAFSGKPEINMAIVRDPANPSGFAEREAAYMQFLRCCWALSTTTRHGKDIWEDGDEERRETVLLRDNLVVESVDRQDFDSYDLVDSSRSRCYVDKRLLGINPHEKVTAVWNETQRHSLFTFLLIVIGYAAMICALEFLVPEVMTIMATRKVLYFIVPLLFLIHVYFKLRGELQCLCVSTNTGRVIQLSRNPPTALGFCFPHFYGGTDVRLDAFRVGKAIYVQLDMPLKPVWEDWMRTWCRAPWRRGVVTVRGDHGLLQVRRTNGEALVAFRAMTQMIEDRKSHNLKVACLGCAEIFGISARRDLLLPGEELIWEWKLREAGHFTDPFNYTSLIAITDGKLHIARARCPKPLSLRGLLLGPRTFGFRCMHFQEMMGHHAGLTITSLAHRSLESYATTRSRAPPFWPGFGPPIDGFGFVFMPKFSQMYLAALSVTQKPYGLSRRAIVADVVRLASHEGGYLRVTESKQHTIPKGARIVSVLDTDGDDIDFEDERWSEPGGSLLEPGTGVLLEAVDHQWNTTSDEPWVSQLRGIMDIILGRDDQSGEARANKDIWDVLEEPPEAEAPSCMVQLGAQIFGMEMMGLHPAREFEKIKADDSESSSEDVKGTSVGA